MSGAAKGGASADERLAARLRRLGLEGDADFAVHLPLRYEDETAIVPVAALRPGLPAQIEGEIVHCELSLRPRRQLTVMVRDDSGQLPLRWLHFHTGMQRQLTAGRRIRVRGEPRPGYHGLEMVHPRVGVAGGALPQRLTPVYPTTQGVTQPWLRRRVQLALVGADLADTLPAGWPQAHGLWSFADAVRYLHAPPADAPVQPLVERTHPAWERIKFDELLAHQIVLAQARLARERWQAPALTGCARAGGLREALMAALPFPLTGAQTRVVAEILADMARGFPMHRLVQGDVGSGKTIVAALAAAQAIDSGHQVALMAPTELLAEQHHRKLSEWFGPLGVQPGWLAGSVGAKARRETLAALASGEQVLVVGTQALIQDKVVFSRLGLVVVDEQHRFGVDQRLMLNLKGAATPSDIDAQAWRPHQLSMSATPIPRTLAMTALADLDVSEIDELPAGRRPVLTKLVANERRDQVIGGVHAAVKTGQQAYWVCPLVEESEALQLQTAVETHERLSAALPDLRVGLVHGKLPTAEKQSVMHAFQAGALDVLVATTVIEVGVDVPNASLMIIEHAERFGLAQLHQLRGRVGRGARESICVLLYQSPLSADGRQRLRAMHQHADGFEIARMDLELRGPGEFLGVRQSGLAGMRYADLQADAALADLARREADTLLRAHPAHAQAHAARWMRHRQAYLGS